MQHVTIAADTLKPETWTHHDVADIRQLLKETFPTWPFTARIYHNQVSQLTDVTPADEAGIELLATLPGPFYVMVYPGEPVTALFVVVGIFIGAAAYVLTAATPPAAQPPPLAMGRNNQISSPNNELSDRSNRARINGRIPDIYGTVRSTPDLIAAPYKIFENNREVEYAYMCIGRGSYEISSVKDGETAVEDIPGTSIAVYGPYTSPNSFDPNTPGVGDPELVIGALKRVPVLTTKRSNSVNGQVLRPPNAMTFTGLGNVRFRTPNLIELPAGSVEDFTKFFVEGDEITITGATMTAGVSVIQPIRCRITSHDVIQKYPRDGANHAYDTDGGSMLFVADYASVVNGLFIAGSTVTLTNSAFVNGNPIGVYSLDGTYTIDSVHTEGPNNPTETKYNVPTLFIVKLDDPNSVNSHWGDLDAVNFRPEYHFAPEMTFDIELDGSGAYDLDLDDVYTVLSVTKDTIVIENPVAVNADWSIVEANIVTPFLSPTIVATGEKWIGPFILEDFEMIEVYCNFVGSNGLYKDDGIDQEAAEVTVAVECTPVDLNDDPLDDSETFEVTLKGSSVLKETVAVTLKAHFSSFFGRTSIRARRLTESDTVFEGTVVDEVRWRDASSVSGVDDTDFGNITTVATVTFATASALALKERKLNMLVQRKIPDYVSGAFTEELFVTKDAALILAAVCRDRYIGNRSLAEIDMENFVDTAEEVEDYFGTPRVREFNYTFDKDNISFQETVATIANAMFSVAYRRGNVIKLSFEKETEDSVLLFNHRNKIPKSEKRTVAFGQSNDNDGVQYTYVDPIDDSINTVYLPEDYASINPKKVDSIGIRDHLAAYFHVWRAYNRIRYQNTIVDFDSTNEADLLIINDRILVSDGTRTPLNEGEVIEVDGLELTLSQNVDLSVSPSYNIFLQLYDGSAQSILVTAGSASNKVVLDEAPLLPLVTDSEMFARTTYVIVGSNDTKQTAFLLTEKSPDGPMTCNVRAINYDARYYGNDKDFINDLIDENGYGRRGGFTPAEGNEFPVPAEPSGIVAGLFNYMGFVPYSGYQNGAWGAADPFLNGFNIGTLLGAFTSGTLNGYLIRSIITGPPSFDDFLYLALEGVGTAPADNIFTSISYVDSSATLRTYNSVDANILTDDSIPGGTNDNLVKRWRWALPASAARFVNGATYEIIIV